MHTDELNRSEITVVLSFVVKRFHHEEDGHLHVQIGYAELSMRVFDVCVRRGESVDAHQRRGVSRLHPLVRHRARTHVLAHLRMLLLASGVWVPAAVILSATLLWFVYGTVLERRRSAARLEALRTRWGHPSVHPRDFGPIARAHCALLEAHPGPRSIDDRTWRDLGMNEVYAHLDRTSTFAGRAALYHRLRAPRRDVAALRSFDDAVAFFERDSGAREKVQTVLASTEEYGQAAILDALFGEAPRIAFGRFVFPLFTIASISILVLGIASPMARLMAVGLGALCIALRMGMGSRTHDAVAFLEPLRRVHALLAVGRMLARLPVSGLEERLNVVRGLVARLAGFGRATSWLLLDATRLAEPFSLMVTYLNAFFLLDLTALAFSVSALAGRREDLQALFVAVGELDAALAVASFRAGASRTCRPEIVLESDALAIEGAVHPLVTQAVPNGVRVAERGILITGSNMSGKSTFVRTVAINALLAQSVFVALATSYRGPFVEVRTLMSANDDVLRNRSYYAAELLGAKELLAPCVPGERALVVLDELFRGTNTSERIAAGKAVLQALQRAGHFVFASTHDLELVGLLRERFEPYHFAEEVRGGELVFPYTLRRGPSTTRNAITLLGLAGFPPEVVADATAVAGALDDRYSGLAVGSPT